MLRPSLVILIVAVCWTASGVGSRKLSQSSVTIINKSPETSVSFPVKTPCVGTQCCEPTDCVCMGDCVEYPFGYGDITTSAAVAATAATTAATTAETATVSSSSNASAQVPECTGLVKATCCLGSEYCPWNWWAPPTSAPPKQCVVENVSWTLMKYPSLFWKSTGGSVCQCPETKTPCAACTSCSMQKKG